MRTFSLCLYFIKRAALKSNESNLSDLVKTKGLYIVEVISGDARQVIRLVVQ